MRNCIVIPTYWSTPNIKSWMTFDHPTPIDEIGTLPRTLENLQDMKIKLPVILFPTPKSPKIEKRVKILSKVYDLDIHLFSGEELKEVKNLFKQNNCRNEFLKVLHLKSYGSIRNMGLIYAALKDYDNVIQIDDDELIEDPMYIIKAVDYMGKKWNGETVLGKTGFYRDKQDRIYYDGQLKFKYKNWPKDELFNAELENNLSGKKRLVKTIGAFGGNMVINKEMFIKVPYDPYGTRGEDDDYAINALYKGFKFFFDRHLWIRHLPPDRKKAYWTRHRQDIIRFKYLREKIKLLGLIPKHLGIFIEKFMHEDLEYMAVSSSIDAAFYFMNEDEEEFREFLHNAELTVKIKRKDMKNKAQTFLNFLAEWSKLMPRIMGLWE